MSPTSVPNSERSSLRTSARSRPTCSGHTSELTPPRNRAQHSRAQNPSVRPTASPFLGPSEVRTKVGTQRLGGPAVCALPAHRLAAKLASAPDRPSAETCVCVCVSQVFRLAAAPIGDKGGTGKKLAAKRGLLAKIRAKACPAGWARRDEFPAAAPKFRTMRSALLFGPSGGTGSQTAQNWWRRPLGGLPQGQISNLALQGGTDTGSQNVHRA